MQLPKDQQAERRSARNAQRASVLDVWRRVATRYHDRTTVAAYELLNEPYAAAYGSWWAEEAVREVDPKALIIVWTGTQVNSLESPINTARMDPDSDRSRAGVDYLIFSPHFYPDALDGSNDATASRQVQQGVQAVRSSNAQWARPFYVGEFHTRAGECCSDAGARLQRDLLQQLAGQGREQAFGWAKWTWKGVDAGDWCAAPCSCLRMASVVHADNDQLHATLPEGMSSA